MQLLLNAAWKIPIRIVVEIFWIADDRMADMQGVDAQLVGTAGIGLHLQPCEVLCRRLQHPVEGNRMVGAVLAVLGDAHAVAVDGRLLDEPGRNLVLVLARHALDQRPVGLFGVALAEGGRQLLRRAARAGDNENTRCVAVETVNKPRLLALRAGPGFEHLVDMPGHTRAALHRKTRGLVEYDYLFVLVQHHARQELEIRRMFEILAGDRSGFQLRIDIHRRHAHRLAGLHARIRFDTPTVNAHLAGAQELLQRTEAEPGKVHLEPAIEPHAGFVGFNLYMFYASHKKSFGNCSAGRAGVLAAAFRAFSSKTETGKEIRPKRA